MLCEFIIGKGERERQCSSAATTLLGTLDLCERHEQVVRDRRASGRPFTVLSQFGKAERLAEEGRAPSKEAR